MGMPETYVDRAGLRVAANLAEFIEHSALPGTGLDADAFWRGMAGIYARFAQAFPGRLAVNRDGSRGAEKRRTLLAYLRDRPEELRPYGDE